MYCTTAQLIKWFGEIVLIQRTDRESNTGSINYSVLDEAIASAERKIDGYLRTVYSLPLSTEMIADSNLPEVCGDIVFYLLHKELSTDEISPVLTRYKDAIAWLKDVQAKRVSLGSQDDTMTVTGSATIRTGSSGIDWSSY